MRPRHRKISLASGLALLASFAFAGVAQATTFPGTNGLVGYSSPLATGSTGSKLEIVTNNGGTEKRCTVNTTSDFNPRFSEDGKMIAYVEDNNVMTMNLATTNGECPHNLAGTTGTAVTPTQVTSGATDSFVGGFSPWDPNPTDTNRKAWIVFQRSTSTHSFEVYKVQVDKDGAPVANTETRMTTNAANDSQPAFRPDGLKIAFHSNRGTPANSNIWVMDNADTDGDGNGDNATNLTGGSLAEESAPAYSSDNSNENPGGTTSTEWRIAFQSDRDISVPGPLSPRNLEIYRMKDDGTGVKRLTYSGPSVNEDVGVINVTGFDLNAAWSPDGSKMCFHSGRAQEDRDSNGVLIHGQWEVYTLDAVNGEYDLVLNPTGTGSTRLTTRPGNDERCGWQEAP